MTTFEAPIYSLHIKILSCTFWSTSYTCVTGKQARLSSECRLSFCLLDASCPPSSLLCLSGLRVSHVAVALCIDIIFLVVAFAVGLIPIMSTSSRSLLVWSSKNPWLCSCCGTCYSHNRRASASVTRSVVIGVVIYSSCLHPPRPQLISPSLPCLLPSRHSEFSTCCSYHDRHKMVALISGQVLAESFLQRINRNFDSYHLT